MTRKLECSWLSTLDRAQKVFRVQLVVQMVFPSVLSVRRGSKGDFG